MDDVTNGMQFKPDVNDGNLNAYDNILQRNILYKYDSDETYSRNGEKVEGKKYVENTISNTEMKYASGPKNTINISPAYNLGLVLSN